MLFQQFNRFRVQFLAGLEIDFAGFQIDNVLRQIAAKQLRVGNSDCLETLLNKLTYHTRGQLLAHFKHDLARIGVDHVALRLAAAHGAGVKRNTPAVAITDHDRLGVECLENFLGIQAERHQQ